MPVVSPLPPDVVRQILLDHGYTVLEESEYNWVLARGDKDEPLIVPRKGKWVSVELMDQLVRKGVPMGPLVSAAEKYPLVFTEADDEE